MQSTPNARLHLFSMVLTASLMTLAAMIGLPNSAFAQNETVIHSFTGGNDGSYPIAGLALDAIGNLYGTTFQSGDTTNCGVGCGVAFELSPGSGGWTESVAHVFLGGIRDGGSPATGLVADAGGNLYGTTANGGPSGCGTVFELHPNANGSWNEKILHSFTCGTDGQVPYAGLITDSAGNLYGTTNGGGNYDQTCTGGCGVVFKLSHSPSGWKETVLHAFAAGKGGSNPSGNLVSDAAGNLYGTTTQGGIVGNCHPHSGCGVVFQLSRSSNWRETVLYSFSGGSDGGTPAAGLAFDSAGSLYGTTQWGRAFGCLPGSCGVVFELSPTSSGWNETTLYTFTGGADGGEPLAGVILDNEGNLYGTAEAGGNLNACNGYGCGVVFELSPGSAGWTETVLHSFDGLPDDGMFPLAGLIFDLVGDLYGTTSGGGAYGLGTVFEISR